MTAPASLFKKTGRRPAGTAHAISVRIPDHLIQRLSVYGNHKGFTLAETIRVVLELGLDAT